MGQAITGWGVTVEKSLYKLFDGTDQGIETLTELISDGKFVEGSSVSIHPPPSDPDQLPPDTTSALQKSISKAFFAFAIPSIWTVSGRFPFVVDAGYSCDHEDDMNFHLDDDTMQLTKACYQHKRYYLATAYGKPTDCTYGSCSKNAFPAPPGVDSMGQGSFGNVTVEEVIIGSVRTYLANGETNGGPAADAEDQATLEDLSNDDITTPGFIRLPVCSAPIARTAWAKFDDSGVHKPDTDAPNYPCVLEPGIDLCGDSTFVDQTSDASPTASDCMQIVENIAHTDGKFEIENAIGSHHQILQFSTCAFGVQGMVKDGNIDFYVGGQDVVDIITESVKRFGGSGKVGAKGEVSCKGTVKGQKVEWGIYHD